jgi:probable rRNA maturation factor
MHSIQVQIDEEFQNAVPVELVQTTALAVIDRHKVTDRCELGVVVTDDSALHDLNLRFREIDSPTDVLSFADQTRGPFISAPGFPRYLGDIVISYPRAQQQAASAGHSAESELQLLVVHGVLHLLGYDDVLDDERVRMWAVQADILHALGVNVQISP